MPTCCRQAADAALAQAAENIGRSSDASTASASEAPEAPPAIVVPKTAEGVLGPADQDAIQAGMMTVMDCYERELRQPIRHLVAGELARTLLIQARAYDSFYL